MNRLASRLPAIVEQHQKEVLAEWLSSQTSSGAWRAGRLQEGQLRDDSQRFLALPTVNQRSPDAMSRLSTSTRVTASVPPVRMRTL